MSNNAYTPGPWAVVEDTCGDPVVVTYRDDQDPAKWVPTNYSASISTSVGDHTESRTRGNEWANAKLIAAAPDLLEALENLMAAYSQPEDRICCSGVGCGCMGSTTYQQAEHYARAAIAKATA